MGDGLISLRTFAYAPDQALVLRGGEFARQIVYGSGWSRIRLGLLCAVRDRNPLGSITGVRLLFGLGTWGSPVQAYATQNFVGVSLIGSPVPNATQTLTYNAGSGGNDYYTPTQGYPFRKYRTNYTLATQMASGAYFPLARNESLVASQNRRAVFIVDITRPRGGAGTSTFSAYCTTTAQVAQDFRPDNMFDAMDRTGTPTLLGTAMTVLSNAASLTVGEEFGPLDALMVHWSRNLFALEIYAVGANVLFEGNQTVGPAGAYAGFEGYNTGTFTTFSPSYGTQFLTSPTTGTASPDSGWASAWSVGGTYPCNTAYTALNAGGTAAALYGTVLGWPQDAFSVYTPGTVLSGVTVNAGTFWDSYGTTPGQGNFAPQMGLSGTSAGMGRDDFQLYAAGTVISGVTLNSGTTWAENAFIY